MNFSGPILTFANVLPMLAITVSVIVGTFSIRTFLAGQRQRKLENSLKLLTLFDQKVTQHHLQGWMEIFVSSSELAGAKPGHFKYDHNQTPFNDLFSEGGAAYDNGAIDLMASQFDLIGYYYSQGTIEIVVIYFELGQYMDTIHRWLQYITLGDGKNLLQSNFKHFDKMYRSIMSMSESNKWPKKTVMYIE